MRLAERSRERALEVDHAQQLALVHDGGGHLAADVAAGRPVIRVGEHVGHEHDRAGGGRPTDDPFADRDLVERAVVAGDADHGQAAGPVRQVQRDERDVELATHLGDQVLQGLLDRARAIEPATHASQSLERVGTRTTAGRHPVRPRLGLGGDPDDEVEPGRRQERDRPADQVVAAKVDHDARRCRRDMGDARPDPGHGQQARGDRVPTRQGGEREGEDDQRRRRWQGQRGQVDRTGPDHGHEQDHRAERPAGQSMGGDPVPERRPADEHRHDRRGDIEQDRSVEAVIQRIEELGRDGEDRHRRQRDRRPASLHDAPLPEPQRAGHVHEQARRVGTLDQAEGPRPTRRLSSRRGHRWTVRRADEVGSPPTGLCRVLHPPGPRRYTPPDIQSAYSLCIDVPSSDPEVPRVPGPARHNPCGRSPRPAHRHRAARPAGPCPRRVRRDVDLAQPAARLPDRAGSRGGPRRRGHRRQPVPRFRGRDRGHLDRSLAPAGRGRDQGTGRRADPLLGLRLLPADLSRGLPRARAPRPDRRPGPGLSRQFRSRGRRGGHQAGALRDEAAIRGRVPRRVPRSDLSARSR